MIQTLQNGWGPAGRSAEPRHSHFGLIVKELVDRAKGNARKTKGQKQKNPAAFRTRGFLLSTVIGSGVLVPNLRLPRAQLDIPASSFHGV